ncbi:MAG TPA: CinA family nicotinamide mononucleotide deamidase-related protein [Candidatus Polarisedimenticolia bacterium]|nr:CinA family nicotinamide mononucleotide deamidase-related protein [Candidatus Polarisedimenticolia bacterium]
MTAGRAAVIAVGTELILDGRSDTNGLSICRRLAARGIAADLRMQLPDETHEVALAFRHAVDRFPLVIVTGGLGPTMDDVTREAACEAFDLRLELSASVVETITRRYAERGRTPTDTSLRQAMVPLGAVVLPNEAGTAPGLLLVRPGNRQVFLLPGVPHEMERMLRDQVFPRIAPQAVAGDSPLARRTLKTAGRMELEVQEKIGDLFTPAAVTSAIRFTLLASAGEVSVIISGSDQALVERLHAESLARLGRAVFTEDLDVALEDVVGRMLGAAGRSISTAESCTGGMLAESITRVPGSSAWFQQGWIVYSNDSKSAMLGLDRSLIERHGAVSEQTADAMANAARSLSGASIGVSITGIAGPDGGSADKPVGLVYIGVAAEGGCRVTRHLFGGDRDLIRLLATRTALNRVRLERLMADE